MAWKEPVSWSKAFKAKRILETSLLWAPKSFLSIHCLNFITPSCEVKYYVNMYCARRIILTFKTCLPFTKCHESSGFTAIVMLTNDVEIVWSRRSLLCLWPSELFLDGSFALLAHFSYLNWTLEDTHFSKGSSCVSWDRDQAPVARNGRLSNRR